MKKNKKPTAYVIAGAVVLCVSLAGNVQAIPISIAKNPGVVVGAGQRVRASRSIDLGNSIMTPINPKVVLVAGADRTPGAARNFNSTSARLSPFYVARHKPPVVTFAPSRPIAGAVSVPDGGTTSAMLGGTFYALVFLKRKLAA